jgi:hypothetical protein
MKSVRSFDPIARYAPPKRCMSDNGRVKHGCRSREADHADCHGYEKLVENFEAQ